MQAAGESGITRLLASSWGRPDGGKDKMPSSLATLRISIRQRIALADSRTAAAAAPAHHGSQAPQGGGLDATARRSRSRLGSAAAAPLRHQPG